MYPIYHVQHVYGLLDFQLNSRFSRYIVVYGKSIELMWQNSALSTATIYKIASQLLYVKPKIHINLLGGGRMHTI